jgi:hypothetical protein
MLLFLTYFRPSVICIFAEEFSEGEAIAIVLKGRHLGLQGRKVTA